MQYTFEIEMTASERDYIARLIHKEAERYRRDANNTELEEGYRHMRRARGLELDGLVDRVAGAARQ